MAPGSSLDVGVSLELPECQANYNVGTFTINVTVYDKQGHAVGQGRRSMVLRHKSSLLQTISTLVFSVPLLMALTSEHQTVSGTAVQLVSLPKGGLHSASLSLSDSRLQVYAASIDITFVLTGFRFYMFHWFLTSMAIGTIIISNLYVATIGWLSQRLALPPTTLIPRIRASKPCARQCVGCGHSAACRALPRLLPAGVQTAAMCLFLLPCARLHGIYSCSCSYLPGGAAGSVGRLCGAVGDLIGALLIVLKVHS